MKPSLIVSALLVVAVQPALAVSTNVFSPRLRSVRFGTRSLVSEARVVEPRSAAPAPHALRLATGAVDTSTPRTKRAMLRAVSGSTQVRSPRQRLPLLIQFDGEPSAAGRAALAQAGCHIAGYVAPNGYLLDAPEAQVSKLVEAPGLRWLGEYKPSYKISPALAAARDTFEHHQRSYRTFTTSAARVPKSPRELPPLTPPAPEETAPVVVHLFSAEDIDATLAGLRALGARDLGAAAGGGSAAPWGRIRARVPFDALDAIAHLAAVQWIEPYTEPKLFNSLAVQPHLMNITPVWSTNWLGLTGRGQIVAHADTGLDQGSFSNLHPDFTNRIHAVFAWGRAGVWSDPEGHGTHTAGSLAGNGSAYSNGCSEQKVN